LLAAAATRRYPGRTPSGPAWPPGANTSLPHRERARIRFPGSIRSGPHRYRPTPPGRISKPGVAQRTPGNDARSGRIPRRGFINGGQRDNARMQPLRALRGWRGGSRFPTQGALRDPGLLCATASPWGVSHCVFRVPSVQRAASRGCLAGTTWGQNATARLGLAGATDWIAPAPGPLAWPEQQIGRLGRAHYQTAAPGSRNLPHMPPASLPGRSSRLPGWRAHRQTAPPSPRIFRSRGASQRGGDSVEPSLGSRQTGLHRGEPGWGVRAC
jgi:hypothetical protein